MGHLGHLKQEYVELIQRLEAGTVGLPEPKTEDARKGWKEILEILYTPEEAEFASRMPTMPTSLRALEKRYKMTQDTLIARLEPMCDKGLIMDLKSPRTGKVKYFLAPPVVGFFEFSLMRAHDMIPKKKIAEALKAYTHHDDTFAREVFGTETTIGRALVHEPAIGPGANGDMPEVLDWERATSIINQSKTAAVSLCYCRHKQEHLGTACDAPTEVCLSLNAGAEFVIRRKFGKEITKERALEILNESRAKGLVQIGDNVMNRPTYICNCCGCCCGQLQSINEYGLHGVSPSGFKPVLKEEDCKGCSRCSRACPIGAIAMQPKRLENQRKNDILPAINEENCIGCGVCSTTCRSDALPMIRRAKVKHVPANSIEKSIRQALERGRLAHLLIDHGAGMGPRFMNEVLRILTRLPVSKQLLANKQLQSRFIKAALSQVKDPTE